MIIFNLFWEVLPFAGLLYKMMSMMKKCQNFQYQKYKKDLIIYGLAIIFAKLFFVFFDIYYSQITYEWYDCVRSAVKLSYAEVRSCDAVARGYSAIYVSLYNLVFLFIATIILFTKTRVDYIANFS